MQELGELFRVFTSPEYESRFLRAKASATCLVCGKKSVRFPSLSAKLEYDISALCHECQSRFFNGIDFDPGLNHRTSLGTGSYLEKGNRPLEAGPSTNTAAVNLLRAKHANDLDPMQMTPHARDPKAVWERSGKKSWIKS